MADRAPPAPDPVPGDAPAAIVSGANSAAAAAPRYKQTKMGKCIGGGSFGDVYEGTCEGKVVAIKVRPLQTNTRSRARSSPYSPSSSPDPSPDLNPNQQMHVRRGNKADIMREADLMRGCDSKYIIKLLDAFVPDHDPTVVWLVMELCFDSVDAVMKRQGRPFTEPELAFVVVGVANALDFLHTAKIIHRDIKAAD